MPPQIAKSNGFTPDDLTNVATVMTALSTIIGVVGAGVKSMLPGNKNKKEDENSNIESLEEHIIVELPNHHLFVKAQHLKGQVTMFDGISNEGREALLQMIISNHIEIFEKYAYMLYNDYKEGLIKTKDHLRNRIHDLYEDFSTEFYSFHKGLHYLDDDEFKATDIVLKHYKKWNSGRMISFLSRVDEICSADYYPTVGVSVVAVFDASYNMLQDVLKSAQESAQYINGHLTGLTFKGVEL